MKLREIAVICLLVFSSVAATNVAPSKSELETMYDKAFRAFDSGKYEESLKTLDAIDARQPDLAESYNLRGVVLMRQQKYEKAEAALHKALEIEPKFWNASFNLAEIPFLKKQWPEARNRFEALLSGSSEAMQGETRQLIQYKILLTFVLQGKEDMVDWMLNKFELSKESPAVYYANAAKALHHKNDKEAKDWLASAQKHFSSELNRLYAESFYEIGWMQKPPGESRAAIEITSTAEHEERMKKDAKATYEKAERAFQQRDFDGALKLLDQVDQSWPDNPASHNLRGEVLMEEKKFDEAEGSLKEAFRLDPKFREAQYNLAQIPFKQKDYSKARDRLEALFSETPGDEKNQAAQLIKFKIFLTLLLEGKDSPAQKMMDQFKFTGDTPALYYAQAAWSFKHGNTDQGNDWVSSARKIYSPALNTVFADSFYDLGWLSGPEAAATPATLALAQASPSPAGATPTMRFGQAESIPSPAAGATASPQATAAIANASAVTAVNSQSSASLHNQPPAVRAASPSAGAAVVRAAPPATVPGVSQEPSRTKSSEWLEGFGNARTLLFGGLMVAGIVLLIVLGVQQLRRQLSQVSLESTPERDFGTRMPAAVAETKLSGIQLNVAPPRFSLQLRATEPSVRPSVLPSGTVTSARSVFPERLGPSSSQADADLSSITQESVSEPIIIRSSTASPPDVPPSPEEAARVEPILRDEEHISLAGSAERQGEVSADVSEAAHAGEWVDEMVGEPEVWSPSQTIPVRFVGGPDRIARNEEPIIVEELVAEDEPVTQGQPIPQLTPAPFFEPVMSELTESKPESTPVIPETAAAAAIARGHAPQSPVETPSFASKIISTQTLQPQPRTPFNMPDTTITPASVPTPAPVPAPAARPTAPGMAVQQPAGGMHTAVQLTFSLEIASMQLTPTFKMSGLQLKPTSRVVTMRLAPSQHPQPPMNLQVTFEVAGIELVGGSIGTVRLSPSVQEKPAVLTSSSFAITGLELMATAGNAPVQLTPTHQEQASVHMTAAFQIAAIEFSPAFEIVTIVLKSTSRNVSMQLPGSGPSSIDSAPIFEIETVQLGAAGELAAIQVNPMGGPNRRA